MDKVPFEEFFPKNWIPVSFDDDSSNVEWMYIGKKDFEEPFFYDMVKINRREHPHSIYTKIEDLEKLRLGEGAKPVAFIFHTSRCGSTLMAQIFAQSERNIVLSEPTVLNDVLMSSLPEGKKRVYLKKLVELLSQKRKSSQRYLIIKWDSWHLLYAGLIKSIFPEVPFIFLYRAPLEVLSSHARMRGSQMVPGLLNIKLIDEKVPSYDLDLYCAHVLNRFYSLMLSFFKEYEPTLVNYTQLPDYVFNFIKEYNLIYEETDLEEMRNRSKFNGKDLYKSYESDTPKIKKRLSDLAGDLTGRNYRQLEHYRNR